MSGVFLAKFVRSLLNTIFIVGRESRNCTQSSNPPVEAFKLNCAIMLYISENYYVIIQQLSEIHV